MKIIVPMAGMGKRMRPHTLTVPKPLIPVAGKPIVQRLMEDIAKVCKEQISEIAFIINPLFGIEVEKNLISIAESLNAKGTICYQKEALGTAHAVYCAKECLDDNVIVAFADTLFIADFSFDKNSDSIIWVQKVEDPSAYGVVKLDDKEFITDFVEKPKDFVSDLAIIGIYYFRDGENLRREIEYLIDNNIVVNGEFQLTDALENMKNKGVKFGVGKMKEWLDCGNKNATVYTNQRVLINCGNQVSSEIVFNNSSIIEPCFIDKGVELHNSVVGPYVSISKNTKLNNCIISNSIIQSESIIENEIIHNSMIGKCVSIKSKPNNYNIGDYNEIE